MLRALCLALLLQGAFPADPAPHPSAVVLAAPLRFTLLAPNLVRIQLQNATAGADLDPPTLSVVNRALPVPPFTVSRPNATATRITTAALDIVFDAAQMGQPGACAVQGGTDAAQRTRHPAFPDGVRAPDAGACCEACRGARGCVAWVWGALAGVPMCWPLAAYSGTAAAADRTLGVLSPLPPGALAITAALPGGQAQWRPGAPNTQQLNGSLAFWDCYTKPDLCAEGYSAGVPPGLLSGLGWTLWDESATHRRQARSASNGSSSAPVPWWAPAPPAGSVDWYFHAYGSDYKGALALAAQVLGPPALPPRWALGVWWSQNYPWTNSTGNHSIVTGVLQEYADLGLPLSTLVLDMDVRARARACEAFFSALLLSLPCSLYLYLPPPPPPPQWHAREYQDQACDDWGSWDFNATAFPDPAGFLAWLGTPANPLGHPLATSLNVHPQTGVYHCLERYAAFASRVRADTARNATIPCNMADQNWVGALWDTYYAAPPLAPVSVWWTDYQGCDLGAAANGTAPAPPPPLLWNNLVYGELRQARSPGAAARPMAFSRYGGLGQHRVPIGFSGDTFQHELTLQKQVELTPTAANALFGYLSHDLGGFHADRTTVAGGPCPGDSDPANATGAELLSRWLQFGAFAPIFRTHCGGCGPDGPPTCACDRRIWRFPTHYSFMRDAMLLRAALLPLAYTLARDFFDSGVAPVRKLYIDAPEALRAPAAAPFLAAQYMFGSDVTVAPVTQIGRGDNASVVNASLWLPPGAWAPWDGAAPAPLRSPAPGGVAWRAAYGQGGIPAAVRAGALLPLALHPAADIASPSPGIAWTLWAAGQELGQGRGALYEDDGESVAYAGGGGGACLRTEAQFQWAQGVLRVTVGAAAGGGYAGAPASRQLGLSVRGWVQRFGAARPASVRANNATCAWQVSALPSLVTPEGALLAQCGDAALNATVVITVLF